jgi:hypothetical protein
MKRINSLRRERTRHHALAFLASTNGPSGTPARPCIGARPLTSSWHASPVAKTAVTPDVHEALDIHGDFAPEVTLNAHLFIYDLTDAIDLIVREISDPSIWTNICAFKDSLARVQPNSKDVWQSGLDTLIPWKIHSRNSRHFVSPLRS